jgi:hypothetical protein
MRASQDQALSRLLAWGRLRDKEPRRECGSADAVRLACDERGLWKGVCLFAYEKRGWTVFEELSGFMGGTPGKDFEALAAAGDLVYIGYNDSIPWAQLVVVENGVCVREFCEDGTDPDSRCDRGRLPSEEEEPIRSWVDVAERMEGEEETEFYSDRGTLLVMERDF